MLQTHVETLIWKHCEIQSETEFNADYISYITVAYGDCNL